MSVQYTNKEFKLANENTNIKIYAYFTAVRYLIVSVNSAKVLNFANYQ